MQDRQPRSRERDEPEPMDPIALTLAVWLGMIVGVTGLIRMSEHAAAQAALAQAGLAQGGVAQAGLAQGGGPVKLQQADAVRPVRVLASGP